jgi:L-ascorbate oxidase
MTTRRRLCASALSALTLFACRSDPSLSPTQAPRVGVANPPEAKIRRSGMPPETSGRVDAPLGDPSGSPVGREATLTLDVKLTQAKIRNPAATEGFDTVRLRSYQTTNTPPDAPFIAPTIRVFPGETVRLTINNELDPEGDCDSGNHNSPHCFNTTNMHAHGMWVSPAGNGDNVLLSIRPKTSFQYEYNIPADHPAGTYWYHPHRHGSTAVQVGSGMAGALIVDGQRLPSATTPGDLDTLLRNSSGAAFRERVLVFQQIPYACRDSSGNIKKDANKRWICDAQDIGEVDRHDDIFAKAPTWQESGRFTTVNGRTAEPLAEHAVAGGIERWRLVHAGVRATIKLQLRKRVASTQPSDLSRMPVSEHAAWIDANCSADQVIDHWEIAADGLTREQMDRRKSTFLQPGYRSDLLVVFPEPGEYCVVDELAPIDAAINGEIGNRQLLTMVTVDAGQTVTDTGAHLKATLQAAARAFMPASVQQKVVDDLEADLRLTAFVPHEDLRSATPSGTQLLLFSIADGKPAVSNDHEPSHAVQYLPTRMDRVLPLGATEDWVLKSTIAGAPHPFHIHINPFQVIAVVNSQGQDLTQDPASQYFNLKGVWKDTLIVEGKATVTARTSYRRYIGEFVLHCHILDHEDRGMMQNISIAVPGR